jgi:hypothetical protein
MSEYQFVYFIAIDRPLSDEQMEAARVFTNSAA